LRQRDPRRHRVRDRQERYLRAPAGDPRTERTERDRAPDPQPTVPDLQRVDRVLAGTEVQLVVGDHVVDPRTDQTERDRPEHDVGEPGRGPAARHPAPAAEPVADEDAGQDAQRVRADRQAEDVPDTLARTGDERRNTHGETQTRHGKWERYSTCQGTA